MSTALRETLFRQLRRSQAHAGLAAALEDFPVALAGRSAAGHRHTAWQQVEHMRRAAEDLVDYCVAADYEAREWPAGYWPEGPEPPSAAAWAASVGGLLAATERMAVIVGTPDHDLEAPVPTAEKATHHTLRAALILLDHNGYHTGQLIALRRALETWPTTEDGVS